MAAILARQGVRFDDVEWVKAGGVLQRFEVLHVNGVGIRRRRAVRFP
jgi:hypothetical protein